MDLKLKALDKSRSDAEYNAAFVHSLNSWRLLSLEMYSILASEDEPGMRGYRLDMCFDRMQEICFNNPVFMKRLSDQVIEVSQRAAYMDHFITEVFTIWLPILYFSKQATEIPDLTSACRHNIKELVSSARNVLQTQSVREIIAQRLEVGGA